MYFKIILLINQIDLLYFRYVYYINLLSNIFQNTNLIVTKFQKLTLFHLSFFYFYKTIQILIYDQIYHYLLTKTSFIFFNQKILKFYVYNSLIRQFL